MHRGTRALIVACALAAAGAAASAGDPAPTGAASDPIRAKLRSLADAGDYTGLLSAADDVLRFDPDGALGFEFRAFALHRLGRTLEARDAYRSLVERATGHAWGWTQLGGLEADLGRPAQARQALDRAVALAPDSKDAWSKRLRVERETGDWSAARELVTKAEAAGCDSGWCAVESATVAWATGDLAAASAGIARAEARGADPAAIATLRRLVTFDRTLSDDERAAQRRGELWRFPVEWIDVETRVGPRLPPNVDAALRHAAKRFGDLLGAPRNAAARFRLVLSRTIDEHERHRRTIFPTSTPGSAFTDRSGTNMGGRWTLTTFAAWPQDGVDRAVAHEFVHLLLAAWCPGAPAWLDEGIATYLEGSAVGETAGAPRRDLLETWRTARAGGRAFAWPDLVSPGGALAFYGRDVRLRYAQSWLVVHWLVHGEGAPGMPGLRRLLARSHDGERISWATIVEATSPQAASAIEAHGEKLWNEAAAPPK